jgi:acyl carrier protein
MTDEPTTLRAHSASERHILDQIEKSIGVRPLSADTTFETMGLRGLEYVEIVMCLEESYKLEIPDHVAMPCRSPAELSRAIGKLLTDANARMGRNDAHA